MVCLINLKEEQINSSSILGGIGLHTSCSGVLFLGNSSLLFAAAAWQLLCLKDKGEFLGKEKEVA